MKPVQMWFKADCIKDFFPDTLSPEEAIHMWGYPGKNRPFFTKGQEVLVCNAGLAEKAAEGIPESWTRQWVMVARSQNLYRMRKDIAKLHFKLRKPYQIDSKAGEKAYSDWEWNMNR